MKRPRGPEDDGPGDIPESSRVRDVQYRSDGGMDDPILKPEHRIFLSHSGAQKDHFVEILCEDLERYDRFPFFDKRPASLPKGDSFPELIRTAIQQCQMAVVVVSDEFFMSEWPMIELDGFVQRRLKEEKQKSETMLKIVPLFYGLSLEDLENPENISKWYKQWEVFAKNDKGIDISSWKVSFGELIRFNGIEFKPRTTDLKVFREEIVKQICKEVPPDVKWDDSHVQGGSNLCQVIEDAISGTEPSEQYGVRVVGVYGIGGMGKTTLCKLLCNKFCEKSDVKSSHVELGSKSSWELLKKVLKDLTNIDQDFVKGLDEGKCWNLLKNSCKQKIFLAIDNVCPDSKSLEEAKKYLKLGKEVHEESVVIVTSRGLETLTSLGVRKEDCLAMPSLEEEDATNLFLYYATSGDQVLNDNDKQAIRECIRLSYFSEDKWNDIGHYLPLALKALGSRLGSFDKRPSEWVKALKEVRPDFNHLQDKENLWLALVHNQSLQEIGNRLQQLKRRSLVEVVDMGAQQVHVQNLFREFANLEASGKLEDLHFEKRKWAYYKNSYPTELLEMMPSRGCWQNLTRVGIVDDWENEERTLSLEGIEWSSLSNVVVLKLCDSFGAQIGDSDLKGLRCLKSLELVGFYPQNTLDGLQYLKHLVYFKWDWSGGSIEVFLGKLPASLKVLILHGKEISLGSGIFDLCSNLAKLELRNCGAGNLDVRNCSALESLELLGLQRELSLDGLQNLSKLTYFRWKHLADQFFFEEELYFGLQCQLPALLQVLEIDEKVSLRSDVFARCTKLSKLILRICRAESLDLRNCKSLRVVELEEVEGLRTLEGLSASAVTLETLTVNGCDSLDGIPGLDQLVGLGSLYLRNLPVFRNLRLTDLGCLTNLEELHVDGSDVELGEEDVRVLASLPRLNPVYVGESNDGRCYSKFRVDVKRRKVLKSERIWGYEKQGEERDLGELPISCGTVEAWATGDFAPP
ncbi:hypothetical protein KC19_12G180800 [Ceratodon purpureus]|uniref:TIR domain-containing protein n=1 Tax=Ceratodon purpureus TaxID=3225 RepID=A0A8T0G950_CERPU|nr:hypothetical protein KC19_12G180800 [Ceratodon purpureus]